MFGTIGSPALWFVFVRLSETGLNMSERFGVVLGRFWCFCLTNLGPCLHGSLTIKIVWPAEFPGTLRSFLLKSGTQQIPLVSWVSFV